MYPAPDGMPLCETAPASYAAFAPVFVSVLPEADACTTFVHTTSLGVGKLITVAVVIWMSCCPSLSVTVSHSACSPGMVNVCVAVGPLTCAPSSPKTHSYDTIVPSGSLEAVPSNVSGTPASAEYGPP